MAKSTFSQVNFNGGEISPRALARVDYVKYANSVKVMENFLAYQLGGAKFRPGTKYVAATKYSSLLSNLIPFQFSSTQSYIIEAGEHYFRFYANKGQLIMRDGDDYVKLLCHFNGDDAATTYTSDDANARTATFVGDAQLDTAQKVFGTASLLLDGTDDYITFPDSADFNFGSGDFTIDMRIRPHALVVDTGIIGQYKDADNFWGIELESTDGQNLYFVHKDGGTVRLTFLAKHGMSVDTWYHIALERYNDQFTFYVNGTPVGTVSDINAVADVAAVLQIGKQRAGAGAYFNGWIDELRISKGVARYKGAAFSIPIAAYDAAGEESEGYAPAWVTSTAYVVGDYVVNGTTIYRCLIAHTSGTFATDLSAGKWVAQTAYEITTPYTEASIFELQYAQNNDVMYIVGQNKHPQILRRLGAVQFSIDDVDFVRGPFLDSNLTNITITPSAQTGATTLTAAIPAWAGTTDYMIGDYVTESGIYYKCIVSHKSTATFADDLADGWWTVEQPTVFHAAHVGSLWRINGAVVKILSYTSSTLVAGQVQPEADGTAGDIGGTAAYTDWAEGAFSDYRGWPCAVVFHEQRLFYGGTPAEPQKFWGSVVGSYDNFETGTDDADAVTYQPASDEANPIRWMASCSSRLYVGTAGGTFSVTGGAAGIAIAPDSINVQFDNDSGVMLIKPVKVGSYLYYLQRNGYQVRELAYNYDTDRQEADDMCLLSDHILRDGLGALAISKQKSPNDRIFISRYDGQVAVLTRNVKQEVMGWSRIIPAESSSIQGEIEGIAVIQNDEDDDEIWVTVRRVIDGTVYRYVEYFTPEQVVNEFDAIFLDSALTLDSPITITGATAAEPVVITAVNHGLSNGDQVKIDNVLGMTELNNKAYLVANKTDDTFELTDLNGVDIDGAAYTAYVSGGEVREMVTAISGLSHLEGETVYVQTDGGLPETTKSYTVSSGAITLSEKAAVVHVGLLYEGKITFLQLSDGAGQTKPRRTYLSTLRLNKSIGIQIGQDEDHLRTQDFVEPDVSDGVSPEPYSGDYEITFEAWWDKQAELVIKHARPLPLFILAAVFRSDVEER